MTDRELLELAAKAAGLTKYSEWAEQIKDHDSPHYMSWALHRPGAGGQADSWNPLTDDGDALRLAASLKIDIEWQATNPFPEPTVEAYRRNPEGDFFCAMYPEVDYRRAIVRAAAEIGKTK